MTDSAVVRFLPPNPEVPGSIPGLVEGWIFGWPSFPLKLTQLSILTGPVKWVPAYMDDMEAKILKILRSFRPSPKITRSYRRRVYESKECLYKLLCRTFSPVSSNTVAGRITQVADRFCIDQFETSTSPRANPRHLNFWNRCWSNSPSLGQDCWSNARPCGRTCFQMFAPLGQEKISLISSFNSIVVLFTHKTVFV